MRLLVSSLFLSALAFAQAPAPVDMGKIGPPVGAAVADFSLTDQAGVQRNLASVMGKNGLMLVFFRSADW